MAFTVTCDACGTAQKFTSASKMHEVNIGFQIYMTGGYQEYPQDMTISCENPKCSAETTIDC